MSLFVVRDAVVQAKFWDGSIANAGQIIEWIQDCDRKVNFWETNETSHRLYPEIKVWLANGDIGTMKPGDWVVKNHDDEFEVVSGDLFSDVYKEVHASV